MMTDIIDNIKTIIPGKHKMAAKGWISFNAQCCTHVGETRDTRSRGGFLFPDDGSVVYHCFNCGYKAGWKPGAHLSYKMRRLLQWMGMDENQVRLLVFQAMRSIDYEVVASEMKTKNISFPPIALPDGAKVVEWEEFNFQDQDFLEIKNYISTRGFELDEYDWYWSKDRFYKKRLIIPLTWNKNIVGFTARSVGDKVSPKYINHIPSDYVFGLDNQSQTSKFAIVCEGVFDAIAVNGLAVLTNDINSNKCEIIDSLGKEIIVVPDRDKSGGKLIEIALEYGWSVAFPEWDKKIKDCSDAHKSYGKLFTLKSILANRYDNKLKIEILRRRHGI